MATAPAKDGRSRRRTYTADEKDTALYLLREVGVGEAARRLGISPYTLAEWKAQIRAFAHSSFVGKVRPVGDRERVTLLAQLEHEQRLEQQFDSRKYRHNVEKVGAMDRESGLDVLLSRSGVVQRHLLEWLDPVFDEVAERLAS